jgi:hypothetical protein
MTTTMFINKRQTTVQVAAAAAAAGCHGDHLMVDDEKIQNDDDVLHQNDDDVDFDSSSIDFTVLCERRNAG